MKIPSANNVSNALALECFSRSTARSSASVIYYPFLEEGVALFAAGENL
jgi:hypothetical protein